MNRDWEELERIAERMAQAVEVLHRAGQHQRAEDMARDARVIAAEAKRQRDAYVDWLWGYG